MSDIQNVWKPTRKYFLNLIYFILSTIIVTAVWPRESSSNWGRIPGILIIVSSCHLILWYFLAQFRSEVFHVTRKTLFIVLIILSFVLLTRYAITFSNRDILLLIPFVIIPIVIRTFYDARLALFIFLISIILSGFMVPVPFEFLFISFITGMVAIFTLTNIYRKGRLFITAFSVALSYSVLYIGLNLMHDGNLGNVIWTDFIIFAINGLLALISYPVIFIFEKKFLFLSDTTLLELADTNQPLLRKLAEEAPGSFQHSLQVANLGRRSRKNYRVQRSVGQNRCVVPRYRESC